LISVSFAAPTLPWYSARSVEKSPGQLEGRELTRDVAEDIARVLIVVDAGRNHGRTGLATVSAVRAKSVQEVH
jgi:predicted phosphoribosyltransferase